MSNYIEIQNRKIGADFEPLVIAEIGINHSGSLKIAKEMVDSAVAAGVEIIKHQTHIVDDEMSSEAKKVIPGNADISIYEIMKKNSLNEEEEFELKRYVENKGVIFISTPFSRKAVDRLVNMNVSAYKIGSGECNNYPLIEYIALQKKPMIVSTGMNNIKSISKTVDIIKANNTPFALLHTTNLYPTPNNLVRLGSMMELPKYFPNIPYGLSDHTISNHACFGAIALGASIVERHFTDSMDRVGPDIICSMDEYACRELIEGANILFEQRKGSQKVAAKEEKVTIDFAFASVVSIRKINKGEVFSPDNIWVKRPGKDGIPAENYNEIIGKRAKNEIQNNVQIKWKDIK